MSPLDQRLPAQSVGLLPHSLEVSSSLKITPWRCPVSSPADPWSFPSLPNQPLCGSTSERFQLEIYKEKMSSSVWKCSKAPYINADSLACLISNRYPEQLGREIKITTLCFEKENTNDSQPFQEQIYGINKVVWVEIGNWDIKWIKPAVLSLLCFPPWDTVSPAACTITDQVAPVSKIQPFQYFLIDLFLIYLLLGCLVTVETNVNKYNILMLQKLLHHVRQTECLSWVYHKHKSHSSQSVILSTFWHMPKAFGHEYHLG